MQGSITRFFLFLILFLIFGCSSQHTVTKSESQVPRSSLTALDSLDRSEGDSTNRWATITTDTTAVEFDADTSATDSADFVIRTLEQGRKHYLLALRAESVRDSLQAAAEFEKAISSLDQLGNYPDIESNKDYQDLLRSVIEDYEKYIASVDILGPESSVFVLREKLNQVIDTVKVDNVHIPSQLPKVTVPLVINYAVEQHLAFYQGRARDYMERWLRLSGKYFPMMKKIFKENGIPEEMVTLSMPESGLNPGARSWARAVGLWQFMKGTGMLYGLKSNWWIDERRDFEKATCAAAEHLRNLYQQYNDWYLVLGAYNAGAGRINRGITRSHSQDFWTMRKYLPRQTRNYIPQYIAVTLICLNPKDYGFDSIDVEPQLIWDEVKVDGGIDLKALAECAATSLDTIQELNPELLRWVTPPGQKEYALRVPKGRKEFFMKQYSQLPPEKRQNFAVHKIRKGETLSHIARRYGVTTDIICEMNHIPRNRGIGIGKVITIPVPNDGTIYTADVEEEKTPRLKRGRLRPVRSDQDVMEYKVKRGDTLGKIAFEFDVRISDLKEWNDIAYNSKIRVGQILEIYPPKKGIVKKTIEPKEKQVRPPLAVDGKHIVEKDETLGEISEQYKVSVSVLKKWNHLKNNKIKVGQELIVEAQTPQQSKKNQETSSQQTQNNESVHIVQKGETLASIADIYGTTVTLIKRINNLRTNKIIPGQSIKIASSTPPQSKPATANNPPKEMKNQGQRYLVKEGDTLWAIALKFNTTVSALQSANSKLRKKIKPGDEITIPQ